MAGAEIVRTLTRDIFGKFRSIKIIIRSLCCAPGSRKIISLTKKLSCIYLNKQILQNDDKEQMAESEPSGLDLGTSQGSELS